MDLIMFLVRGLWADKSLMRLFLNRALKLYQLRGRVLDVGAGGNTKYLDFMPREAGTQVAVLDPKQGGRIDFERDALPHADNSFDQVVLLNVLEHVFAYEHLIREVARVIKTGGTIIGFTPFLVRFHPDPHDYFRYTDEALVRILSAGGLKEVTVTPVGAGPFLAAVNILVLSIPRPVRIFCTLIALPLDRLFIRLRPKTQSIYPMGYLFVAKK